MNLSLFPLVLTAAMAISTSVDLPGTAIVPYPRTHTMTAVSADETALPEFAWTSTVHDFGTIKHNEPVSHEFRFVNKGAEPLVITSVQASCGCTVAKYSKDPIAPGGEGFVTATYNAATMGAFNKTVTVNANTKEGSIILSIRGEVK